MAAKRRNTWLVLIAPTVLCCGVGAIVLAFVLPRLNSRPTKSEQSAPKERPPLPIREAKQTAVVPTLDTPLPEGQSVVWCASFQLAWDRLKADVTRGPVQIRAAEAIAQRLNRAQVSEAELRPEDYFAVAGTVSEGVVGTIRREMARRFPDAALPELDLPEKSVVAFGYLAAEVPWRYEFHDNRKPLEFIDSAGRRHLVRSFGILEEDRHQDGDAKFFRGQVAMLWRSEGTETDEEFALDLCRHSTPYQVVLARVKRQATLADTLNRLQRKIEQEPAADDHLHEEDELLVPTMHWHIEQHFGELEGPDKLLMGAPTPGLFVALAAQGIQFRLDRRGAAVASEGLFVAPPNGRHPRRLHFDRPFLLYLKKRDAKQPLLVMWVDNAGIMQPFEAAGD